MLLHKGTKNIEFDRFLLRKYTEDDTLFAFRNWVTDEEVTRYLTWRPHSSLKVTADYIRGIVAHYTDKTYHWVIALKDTNEVIGSVELMGIDEENHSAKFGYCLSKSYWNKGIITQAMNVLLDYWFNNIGFEKIVGLHAVNNPASGRVMQKVGMEYIGVVSGENKDNTGNYVDCATYEITKESFNSITVRKAYSYEVGQVGSLYFRLTEHLEKGDNKCGWKTGFYPTDEVATQAFEADCLYVAVKSGRVAGSAVLNNDQAPQYKNVKFEVVTDTPLVVHTMAIDPAYMRLGIAVKLLAFAEELAKKLGFPCIRLDTSITNTPAITLYEKCGYKNCGIIDLEIERTGITEWYVFEKKI